MTLWRSGAILAAALLIGTASARAAESVTAILDPYFTIQSQLTDDKLDGVRDNATAIETAAAHIGSDAQPIATAAHALAGASTLEAARQAFSTLSDAVIAYAQTTKAAVDGDVATVYCPMVKKTWLQKGTSVRNPYLGKAMRSCGEVKKKGAV